MRNQLRLAVAYIMPSVREISTWANLLQSEDLDKQYAALIALNKLYFGNWSEINNSMRTINPNSLIRLLDHDDPKVCYYAAKLFLHLHYYLEARWVMGFNQIIQEGFIEHLLESIQQLSNDSYKIKRIKLISFILRHEVHSWSVRTYQAIVSHNMVPVLLANAQNPNDRLKKFSLIALSNILEYIKPYSCEIRELLISEAAIDIFLAAFYKGDESIKIWASFCLDELVRKNKLYQSELLRHWDIEKIKPMFKKRKYFSALSAILSGLTENNTETQNIARELGLVHLLARSPAVSKYPYDWAKAITSMCRNNLDNQELAAELNIIKYLVEVLKPYRGEELAVALGALAQNNFKNQNRIRGYGGVEKLADFVQTMRQIRNEEAKSRCIYALGLIADNNLENQEIFRKKAIINTFVQYLLHNHLKHSAQTALLSLSKGNVENTREVLREIHLLKSSQGVRSNQIQLAALDQYRKGFLRDTAWSRRDPLVLRRALDRVKMHEEFLRECAGQTDIEDLRQYIAEKMNSHAFQIAVKRVLADNELNENLKAILSQTVTPFRASGGSGGAAAGFNAAARSL
ncbi:MAG: hypothetical protein K0R66_913 [Gammaproteobacteria bacterium]|jgi:hypothetical protein|nr:hypothetical protein [Gammaproteobacteria bacterium]